MYRGHSKVLFRRCFEVDYVRPRRGLEDTCLRLSVAFDAAFEEFLLWKVVPYLRSLIMAQKNWKNEFVKYELSGDEVEAMKAALMEVDDPFNLLTDLIRDGYRVNIRFVEERDAANVVLIPITDGNPNAGFMLSAFHRDPLKALFEVWYIHFVASDRRWSTGANKRDLYW